MNAAQSQTLALLIHTQEVAALGTLHDGEPFVSMVPYALLPGGAAFVVHVSRLAAHTKDMLANPAVSLLVIASPEPGVPAQARPRVTIQGSANPCVDSDPRYGEAKSAYLARFPDAADMFSFADFSLFVIEPRSARFIGGFAQATSLGAESLARILNEIGV
jgi:putative heme iron utilization protein